MKPFKSVLRKIVGKQDETNVIIDIVTHTKGTYCIVGWYDTENVSAVNTTDLNNKVLPSEKQLIERPDVRELLGKKAQGFQLLCDTSLTIDEIRLQVTNKKGQTENLTLSLKGELPFLDEKKEVVSKSMGDIKGNCEVVIVGENKIFLSGWLLSDTCLNDAELVRKDKNVGTVTYFSRYKREDVESAFPNEEHNKNAGFIIFMDKTKDFALKDKIEFLVKDDDLESAIPVEAMFGADEEQMLNAKRLLNNWFPHIPSHLKQSKFYLEFLREIYNDKNSPTVTRFDFGEKPISPKASIIIPLYGRFDFIRYQLSRFSITEQTRNCEVIYVVDDPSIVNSAIALSKEMAEISDQAFSLLCLSENVGFGKANNIGVSYAKSDYIVLLNSDAIPKSSDWLDKMLETASQEDTGIVGARLLFEDECIQHDGMAPMRIQEYPNLIFNDHPRKGWPKILCNDAISIEPCALLTAACWVMKKEDFTSCGGFDPSYVLGDFEDSDLCLKMMENNKTNYIRKDVELYHLERQSQNLVEPGRWKHNITILNAIHFNAMWEEQLKGLEEVGQ